jgi:hypothetical protein
VPTWREVARIVLHIDPDREAERARQAFDSHLARAKWMSRYGYRHLPDKGWQHAPSAIQCRCPPLPSMSDI